MKKFLKTVAEVGPYSVAFRALYAVENALGFREVFEPAISYEFDPEFMGTTDSLRRKLVAHAWFGRGRPNGERLAELLGEVGTEETIVTGRLAAEGVFSIFEHECFIGTPIDWHRHPFTGHRFPRDHFAKLKTSAAENDLRSVWELARFGHVYDYVRAFTLSGDAAFVDAFERDVLHFLDENPVRVGVHWTSAQEVAIRCLAWIVGVGFFREHLSDAFLQKIVAALFHSAEHIAFHIELASTSIQNNHLIGEALALYLIAQLLPDAQGASEWKRTGDRFLRETLIRQFSDDGGYIQSSHVYHRLATAYFLYAHVSGWSTHTDVQREHPFLLSPPAFDQFAGRTATYFRYVADKRGHVSNWGPNDGARLGRFDSESVRDVRSLISAVQFAAERTRTAWHEEGNHRSTDELGYWLFGDAFLDAPARNVDVERFRSFPQAGLHVLESSDRRTRIICRAGDLKARFGHDDNGHVDIMINDRCVAIDPGTKIYSGTDEDQLDSAYNHNTITVDGIHRRRLTAFTWSGTAEGSCEHIDETSIHIKHDGLLSSGLSHRRQISVDEESQVVDVTDVLTRVVDESVEVTLRWHLEPFGWELFLFEDRAELISPFAVIDVSAMSLISGDSIPVESGSLTAGSGPKIYRDASTCDIFEIRFRLSADTSVTSIFRPVE